MADICVRFVLPDHAEDESDASPIMVQAYDSCKQTVDNVSWVKEADLSTTELTKLDYVVFENFDGKDFSKFIDSKCAVLGPLALSVCLVEGKSIPSFQWPILNVAMYGCEVTCSQLPKDDKLAIQKKVNLMGGFYTRDFISSTTHLICNETQSEKCMRAAEKGIKLMLPKWVDYIFEASQSNNVSASDPKILEKYTCPVLHNLLICSTGIESTQERRKLSELISANGGILDGRLMPTKTDILICHGPGGTTSEKYKAARNSPYISCVTLEWIYDSIDKGYALPHEKYRVKAITSTPTKDGENMDPNFSTISAIGESASLRRTHIDETLNVTHMTTNDGHSSVSKRMNNKRKAEDDLVENIDIKKVKNAGNFLDGCSVFVAGFSSTCRDKLNKIINISGATRYDDFSERVSHVIVGDPTCSEVTTIRALGVQCSLVSIQWLLDSVEQQKPVSEDQYLVINIRNNDGDKTNISSPLSKKVMKFLREDKTLTGDGTNTKDLDARTENHDPLTQTYLENVTIGQEEEDTLAKLLGQQNNPMSIMSKVVPADEFNIRTPLLTRKKSEDSNRTMEFRPQDTSTQISQVTTNLSESEHIFKSCKFILDGFNEEDTDVYKNNIDYAGGFVVDRRFKGICDYAVFPIVYKPGKLPPAQEIVNELWLLQSIENRCLCTDIQYYHRPIELQSTCLLQDCVITVSGHASEERTFLQTVIKGLGGIFQESFSRRPCEAKKTLASTLLICSEPCGKKYEAALKWNIPVVNKDWLLECARTGKKVALQHFLIGDSANSENENTSAETTHSNSNETNHAEQGNTIDENKEKCVSTPKGMKTLEPDPKTPVNQIYNFNQKDTPDPCSQVTPINKILQDAINNKVLPTPPSPKTYYPWAPKTPDTPIGVFIRPNPSPGLRKEMQKYVNSFPEFVPPKRRISTPLSELKKRLMDKVLGRGEYSQTTQNDATSIIHEVQDETSNTSKQTYPDLRSDSNEHQKSAETSIENIAVQQKLQELQERVMASGSSSATRRSSRMYESATNLPGIEKRNVEIQSQVCTVGWDYGEEKSQKPKQKIFMISGVEISQREQLSKKLETLGAIVLERSNYDSSSTHLICPKPGRNEKTLACMAAGKWILHICYVEKSVAAGHFLDEEEFEFGNPKARSNVFNEEKDSSICYWRKEIARRGYGAFNDMRAIVIAERKEPIVNVIEAGGGFVVDVVPPFDDSIHATHCLLEIKMVKDFSKYVILAQQGIKCVNTIYINDFLWRTKKDDVDYILPYFSRYYK